MSHKKRTSRTNASDKAVEQDHLSAPPSMPISQKTISQGRFPSETPLTGEDRPTDQAGHKRHTPDPSAATDHSPSGHPSMKSQGLTTMPPSPTSTRRGGHSDHK